MLKNIHQIKEELGLDRSKHTIRKFLDRAEFASCRMDDKSGLFDINFKQMRRLKDLLERR